MITHLHVTSALGYENRFAPFSPWARGVLLKRLVFRHFLRKVSRALAPVPSGRGPSANVARTIGFVNIIGARALQALVSIFRALAAARCVSPHE